MHGYCDYDELIDEKLQLFIWTCSGIVTRFPAKATMTLGSSTESSPALVAATGFGLGAPERETGFGNAGRGHVVSFSESGQKVSIWSYRYHSLSCDNPFGKICCGNVDGGGIQLSFKSESLIFLESQRS